jgi:hypothetical protein
VLGGFLVDRESTTEKAVGAQIAEDRVSVRYSGLNAPAPITDGTRDGLRTARAYTEQTVVYGRYATPASSDCIYLHHGHAKAVTLDIDMLDGNRYSVLHQANVAACSTHIDREQIGTIEYFGPEEEAGS